MHPILISLGPLKVHSYGLMIAIGFLLALYFVRKDAVRAGLNPEIFTNLAYWCLFLGILGTRILYIIMFPDQFSWSRPQEWLAIWQGGLVFQGGPPVAAIFAYFYLRKHKVPFWQATDIGLPYLALGHAFGRLGCFLNGCCYGERCDLPWAIRFPVDSPAWHDHREHLGLPLDATASFYIHPTQLYGFAGLLLLCVVLILIRNRWSLFPGIVVPSYLILYGIARFFMEMIRGDRNPTHWGPITDQQMFSLLSVLGGIILFLILWSVNQRRSQHAVAPTK